MVRRSRSIGGIGVAGGAPRRGAVVLARPARLSLAAFSALCAPFFALSAPARAQDPAATASVRPASRPNYASAALQTLVAEASRANSRIPDSLRSYQATVETEMAVAVRDSAGHERTTQLEQVASRVLWVAPDRYDQRVIGYRQLALGPTFSLMSLFGGWTTPTLYGNRLRLGVSPASSAATTARRTRDAGLAVHPLAEARDLYYDFKGGDTVATLATRTRRIPIVRLQVAPRPDARGDAVLFVGDVDLDAQRLQVVRMRGRMVELKGGRQTIKSGSRLPGVSGASFVELVNAEVDERFWLPAYQRTEIQADFALLGDLRSLVRIVSRFRDYRANDGTDSTIAPGHRLAFAPSDSLARYADWQQPLGAVSGETKAVDFDDVAPDAWRSTGRPTLRLRPRAIGDVFRFNRVEGAFTGLGVEYDPRDAAPGLSLRASGGWAWAEKTVRGNATAQLARGPWTTGLRLERALITTNDFRLPLAGDATLSALLGSVDDFDYVDRWAATAFTSRALGAERHALLRLEVGPARDAAVQPHIERGLIKGDSAFRPVRGIEEGSYLHTVAALELNPQVSAFFLERGVGARLTYDRADGGVRWQRAELRAAARRELGVFQLASRVDAGMLLGHRAPQAMFEVGQGEGLTAYDYKEFGGDRAAIARGIVAYNLPFLRAPMILPSRLVVPGIAPGIAVGIQGGWAEASNAAARAALFQLGTVVDSLGVERPVSRPTDGIRASADLRLTFFSGAASIGVARAIDHADRWKFIATLGQAF